MEQKPLFRSGKKIFYKIFIEVKKGELIFFLSFYKYFSLVKKIRCKELTFVNQKRTQVSGL